MGSGRELVYNIISIVFALLTVAAVIGFGVVLTSPAPAEEVAEQAPTRVIIPTNTPTDTPPPSNTPRPTLPPTFTPTNTASPSPEPTDVPTSTLSPTPTITLTPTITDTPSETDTPTVSPTPSITPGPSPTPPSPYLFRADPIRYEQNTRNQAGCEWQGIGGTVLALDGSPYGVQLQVHAFGGGIDRTVQTGSNSLYGAQTGYEIRTADSAVSQSLFVQLESVNGVAISERYEVIFPGNCNSNLARVTWVQQREP